MKLILMAIAMIFCCVGAHAARLDLKNGDRITGRWLDSNEETVRFVSDYGSVVRVPRDQVATYIDDDGAEAALPAPNGASLPAAAKAPSIIPTPERKKFLGATWTGHVAGGAGLQTGNTDDKSLSADAGTRAKWAHDRANIDIDYNWQQTNDETAEDNRTVEGNFDRFLPPEILGDDRWYVNANGLAKQDKVANLDLRSVLGVGLGRQFYETDTTYLSASLGPSWLRQKYEDGELDSRLAGRWNIDYSEKFFDNFFSLYHKHSLYLPVNDVSAWIFDADSGVKIPIRDGFSTSLDWQLDINRDPADRSDTTDSIYTLKFGYDW